MIELGVRTRKVVVVGRDPRPEAAAWIADAADRAVPLLLLTLGYPVSADQGRLVATLVDEAFDRGVPFEAVLVPGCAGLAAQLMPGDDVMVVARGRERRRITGVVGERTGHREAR